MKVTEAMARLGILYSRYGDADVFVELPDGEYMLDSIDYDSEPPAGVILVSDFEED